MKRLKKAECVRQNWARIQAAIEKSPRNGPVRCFNAVAKPGSILVCSAYVQTTLWTSTVVQFANRTIRGGAAALGKILPDQLSNQHNRNG